MTAPISPEAPPLLGRVVRSFGKHYLVDLVDGGGRVECVARGKFRLTATDASNPVVAGDEVRVLIEGSTSGMQDRRQGTILEVLPRRSRLSRKATSHQGHEHVLVANIDQVVVVASIVQPDLKLGVIDRILVATESQNLPAVIVLTKSDLLGRAERKVIEEVADVYRAVGYPTLIVSTVNGDGMAEVREQLRDKVSTVAGQSGVGKSSLLNTIQPGLSLRVGVVSKANDKGKHTTTNAELVLLDELNGYVADTPGIRAFGLYGIASADVQHHFREFRPLLNSCGFYNCTHIHEPKCAIRAAVDRGEIDEGRYDSYVGIHASLVEEEANQFKSGLRM